MTHKTVQCLICRELITYTQENAQVLLDHLNNKHSGKEFLSHLTGSGIGSSLDSPESSVCACGSVATCDCISTDFITTSPSDAATPFNIPTPAKEKSSKSQPQSSKQEKPKSQPQSSKQEKPKSQPQSSKQEKPKSATDSDKNKAKKTKSPKEPLTTSTDSVGESPDEFSLRSKPSLTQRTSLASIRVPDQQKGDHVPEAKKEPNGQKEEESLPPNFKNCSCPSNPKTARVIQGIRECCCGSASPRDIPNQKADAEDPAKIKSPKESKVKKAEERSPKMYGVKEESKPQVVFKKESPKDEKKAKGDDQEAAVKSSRSRRSVKDEPASKKSTARDKPKPESSRVPSTGRDSLKTAGGKPTESGSTSSPQSGKAEPAESGSTSSPQSGKAEPPSKRSTGRAPEKKSPTKSNVPTPRKEPDDEEDIISFAKYDEKPKRRRSMDEQCNCCAVRAKKAGKPAPACCS